MRTHLFFGALAGILGVSAGAFGAHALKDTLLANNTTSTWQTGVLYTLIHAPLVVATCFYRDVLPSAARWLALACTCWLTGILLFSGSLCALALQGPRWLGPITPLGGLFLIAGWACLLGHAWKRPTSSEK